MDGLRGGASLSNRAYFNTVWVKYLEMLYPVVLKDNIYTRRSQSAL